MQATPAPPAPGTDTGNRNKFDSVAEAVKTSAQIPQGFKELIGRRCEERGIVWRPVAGRWREGKQLYLCGQRWVLVCVFCLVSKVLLAGNATWIVT